jgi:hypothetical protein
MRGTDLGLCECAFLQVELESEGEGLVLGLKS